MEFLGNLRFISVPRWARMLIFVQLVGAIALSIYMLHISLQDSVRADWIQASAYVLGIIFPIFIIAIIIWSSETGPHILQARTLTLLTGLIPEFLERIVEGDARFWQVPSKAKPSRFRSRMAKVQCNAVQGRSYCDYVIDFPYNYEGVDAWRRMMIRLEINVKKVNFNLYLDKEQLLHFLVEPSGQAVSSLEQVSQHARSLFQHTIAGAESAVEVVSGGEKHGDRGSERYSFNERLLERSLHERDYWVLVALRPLSSDFLWNPAERLFFAQDLMFMLRAFVAEQPQLFAVVDASTSLRGRK